VRRATAHATLALWLAAAVAVMLPLLLGAGSGTGMMPSQRSPEMLGRIETNTTVLALVATLLAVLLGVPAGLAVARGGLGRWRTALAASLLATLFIPPGVMAVVATHLFGGAGIITDLIWGEGAVFAPNESLGGALGGSLMPAPVYTITGAGCVLAVCYAPIVAAATAASLALADPHTEEAARLDAGPWRTLWHTTLPLAGRGIAAGAAIVLLLACVDFSVPESLRALPVMVGEVYVQFGVYYDTAAAVAASLRLVLRVLLLVAAFAPLLWRLPAPDPDEAATVTARRGAPRLAVAAGILAALLPPFTAIATLWWSIGADGADRLAQLGQTVRLAGEELVHGNVLALAAAALCLAGGCVLGAALAALERPVLWRLALGALALIPGPVWGAGIATLTRLDPERFGALSDAMAEASDSAAPLLLAWTLRFAPLAALLLEQALRRIPATWPMAAALEGAGLAARIRAYLWPALWPMLLAAGTVVYALALADAGAAILLLPPGPTTLSVRILTLMHFAPREEVGALCLLALVPPVALALAAAAALRRARW
jgi:iron(III) transport system permease protein